MVSEYDKLNIVYGVVGNTLQNNPKSNAEQLIAQSKIALQELPTDLPRLAQDIGIGTGNIGGFDLEQAIKLAIEKGVKEGFFSKDGEGLHEFDYDRLREYYNELFSNTK